MRIQKFIPTLLLVIGFVLISNTFTFANKSNLNPIVQDGESIRVDIKVVYLGHPLEGVVVSIMDAGSVLAKSTTNRKGKVRISIKNLNTKTVDLTLEKEGYKTQILAGIILINKGKYEFSLMKGEGVLQSDVETDIPNIKEKSELEIKKIDEKTNKHIDKAEEHSKKADKEDKRRKKAEEKTSKSKRELRSTKKSTKEKEEQLLPSNR